MQSKTYKDHCKELSAQTYRHSFSSLLRSLLASQFREGIAKTVVELAESLSAKRKDVLLTLDPFTSEFFFHDFCCLSSNSCDVLRNMLLYNLFPQSLTSLILNAASLYASFLFSYKPQRLCSSFNFDAGNLFQGQYPYVFVITVDCIRSMGSARTSP